MQSMHTSWFLQVALESSCLCQDVVVQCNRWHQNVEKNTQYSWDDSFSFFAIILSVTSNILGLSSLIWIFKRKQRSNLLDNEFLEIIWKVMNWKWMILVWMQNTVSIRPFAFHFLQIQCTKKFNGHRFLAITGQTYNYNIGVSGQILADHRRFYIGTAYHFTAMKIASPGILNFRRTCPAIRTNFVYSWPKCAKYFPLLKRVYSFWHHCIIGKKCFAITGKQLFAQTGPLTFFFDHCRYFHAIIFSYGKM